MGNKIKENLITIKVTNQFKEFVDKLYKNIIKADGDVTTISERTDAIVYYFKDNNDSYLNFVRYIVKKQNV